MPSSPPKAAQSESQFLIGLFRRAILLPVLVLGAVFYAGLHLSRLLVSVEPWWLHILQAMTEYLLLGAVTLALLARPIAYRPLRWVLDVVLVVQLVTVLAAWIPARLTALPPPSPNSPKLRLLTLNLSTKNPAEPVLFEALTDPTLDVLLLQEYSIALEQRFKASNIFEHYPHVHVMARPDAFGSAIFSRHPLKDLRYLRVRASVTMEATVKIGDQQVVLVNLHFPTPFPEKERLLHQGTEDLWSYLALPPGRPLVIAGDWNATPYNRLLRGTSRYLRNAWDEIGWGPGHTFPTGRRNVPPVRIDHVCYSEGLRALEVRRRQFPGANHLGLEVLFSLE